MSPSTDQQLRPRVLVVDDNVDAADLLAILLQGAGCETRVSYSGTQALSLGAHFLPHFVFLDIGMPVMDGFETCRRMRQTPWGETARIAALTAWSDERTRLRIGSSGMDLHLTKPLSFDRLMDIVATMQG